MYASVRHHFIFVWEDLLAFLNRGETASRSIDNDISTTTRNATARFEIADCPKGSKESRTKGMGGRRGYKSDRKGGNDEPERRKKETAIIVREDGTVLSFRDAFIIVYAT